MQNKLLIICGPTATGKTKLGIHIAKKFGGEIVSADSRQIYKKLNIGTGKEWDDKVNIWGYDLAGPKEEFSVSHFLKFALEKIEDLAERGKLPIVVGGTGLYIKGLVDGIPTIDVPRNEKLRLILGKMEADELFEKLAEMDPSKAASMNVSDRKNPRRLVRAVEIAQFLLDHKGRAPQPVLLKKDVLWIGLAAPQDALFKRIDKRVDERIEAGVKDEIKNLLKEGVEWSDQSMLSLGYRQWRDYFEGGAEEERVIDEWRKEEKRYAKRQMVWFKKDKRINWFDITDKNYILKVEKLVQKWHNRTHA